MGNAPAGEEPITVDLVRALLAEQAPYLAELAISPCSGGWDNEIFRLGDSMLVRLPRGEAGARLTRHEIRWVPVITPHLPVDVPSPIVVGRPGHGFPWPWSVVPWIAGTRAAELGSGDRVALAEPLADVLHALHITAPADAPDNPARGGSLNRPEVDERFRSRLAEIGDGVDSAAVLARWEAWRAAPDWDDPDVWLHGDLHPLNLIVGSEGGLAGVIDWGDVTAGDPAVDLATAWLTFGRAGRRLFVRRANLSGAYDADTWTRARAWALHLAVTFLATSDDRPALREIGRHAARHLLADPIA